MDQLENIKKAILELSASEFNELLEFIDSFDEHERLDASAEKKEVIETIQSYFDGLPVKKVFIFGSFAREDFSEESDLDLYIDFDEDHPTTLFDLIKIKQDLEDELNRPVDVVRKGSENPDLRDNILREQQLVYESK